MFRFTIRELVLLTLVVAMGVGWWMDRQRPDAASLDSRHGRAVAERHLDEYRRAYIELHRAVERDGFTITSSNGRIAIVDAKGPASDSGDAIENTSETISTLP